VPRERLPPPGADEFYHVDLIGLAAVTADGTEVGTVIAVHDFGAGDILELRPPAGGTTIMLPFTDAFVPAVDVAAGRITVAPPEETPAKQRDE
jgi:16S rRNA processing protein RimM